MIKCYGQNLSVKCYWFKKFDVKCYRDPPPSLPSINTDQCRSKSGNDDHHCYQYDWSAFGLVNAILIGIDRHWSALNIDKGSPVYKEDELIIVMDDISLSSGMPQKECWALLINICPWSFQITTDVRASPHPYLILVSYISRELESSTKAAKSRQAR